MKAPIMHTQRQANGSIHPYPRIGDGGLNGSVLAVWFALASLALAEDPGITVQPTHQTVSLGGTLQFPVGMTSTDIPLHYQRQYTAPNLPEGFTNVTVVARDIPLQSNGLITPVFASANVSTIPLQGPSPLTEGRAGASMLVGLRTDELVLIDTEDLGNVRTLSHFDPPEGLSLGHLTFHSRLQRLFCFGYAGGQACGLPTVSLVEFVLPQGIPQVLTTLKGFFESIVYVDPLDSFVVSRHSYSADNCITDELLSVALDGTLTHLQRTSLDGDAMVYDALHDSFYTTDSNGVGQLQRMDLATGSITSLGAIPFNMGDMAFSPAEATLYALNETGNGLFRITPDASGSTISVSWAGDFTGLPVAGIAFVPEVVLLATNQPPTIQSQVIGQTNYVGENLRLHVLATGSWPLSYQWLKDGTNIEGGTNRTLVLSNVTLMVTGDYTVVVTNALGAITSTVERVEVLVVTPEDLTNGMVAYYPFNGNANDESGGGKNGVVYGATLTPDRFGVPNNAYQFNGIDQYIELSGTEQLSFVQGGFTLCAWVIFGEAVSDADRMIIAKHREGYPNGYFLESIWLANQPAFFVNDDPRVVDSTGQNDGRWHHIVGTFDGAEAILYVDGIKKGRSPQTVTYPNDTPISIGRCFPDTGSGRYFGGVIDQVRIYNRALLEPEIKALYSYNDSQANQPLHVRSELVEKGAWSPSANAPVHKVAASGTRALVASGESEVHLLDLGNPAKPRLLGTWQTLFPLSDIELRGNIAYVASYEPDLLSTVEIVDFTDPAKPLLKGYYDTAGYAEDVEVVGGIACVADSEAGLLILDVMDPAFPRRIGSYDTKGSVHAVQMAGRYAYIAQGNWLVIVDISNPNSPMRMGAYEAPGAIQGINVRGSKVYLAEGRGDLRILDVSDPKNVGLIGTYRGWGGMGLGMAISGKYAYLGAGDHGLYVLDVVDPAKPTYLTGAWTSPAEDAALIGNCALVAGGGKGLLVYEVQQRLYPPLKPPVISGAEMTLTWATTNDIRLQTTTNLLNAVWRDVPESEGTNTLTLPVREPTAFFRLVKAPKPLNTLFYEDFQSGVIDASKWTIPSGGITSSAVVVDDPLDTTGANKVLTFSQGREGGDLFSTTLATAGGGLFEIQWDCLGLRRPESGEGTLGGFLGISQYSYGSSHCWLAMFVGQPDYQPWEGGAMFDDGQWDTYRILVDTHLLSWQFGSSGLVDGSPFALMLEDCIAWGGIPEDVYFDNIIVRKIK